MFMGPKAKILVADDDMYIRELIKDTLESDSYQVITATDGNDALDKAYTESPDIIILDVNMPHKDGYEVCERIRKDILMSNLPIIMLTVKSTDKDEIKGLTAGVDDYLTKPFKPAVLLARIRSALQRVQQGINVNPLTYLPGNTAIIKEIEDKLKNGCNFAVLYIDLDNFKALNDYYGFQRGDDIIKETARIILSAIVKKGGFVGHIGGDDFIATIPGDIFKRVCEEIIENFDSSIKQYYNDDDLKNGHITIENRRGEKEKFPIVTISIGVVLSKNKEFSHVGEISRLGSELKKYAKKQLKSNYVVDRRRT